MFGASGGGVDIYCDKLVSVFYVREKERRDVAIIMLDFCITHGCKLKVLCGFLCNYAKFVIFMLFRTILQQFFQLL